MGKQSLLDSVREWIGGVAFCVFLWSIRMTQEKYLDAVTSDAIKSYMQTANDNS